MMYGSKEDVNNLKKDYIKIFANLSKMRSQWVNTLNAIKKIDAIFAASLPRRLDELLVMDFVDLVPIYETYIKLQIPQNLKTKIKALFSYDSVIYRKKRYPALQPMIAKFFMDKANQLDIYTCKYCDTAYINVYETNNKKKNHFDLDHMLDKGKCPIVGLCLFNFVPSCSVCNEKIKRSSLPAKGEVLKKLSPTSPLYQFDENVQIVIEDKKGSSSTLDFEKRLEDFDIKFDCHKDRDYQDVVDFFKLEERYDFHKVEALRLMDLQERYTNTHIIEIAKLITGHDTIGSLSDVGMVEIAKIRADIFASNFHEKYHRILGKLYKDIIAE